MLLKLVLMLVMIGIMWVLKLLIWVSSLVFLVLLLVVWVVFRLVNSRFSLWVLVWCRKVYSFLIRLEIVVFLCMDWFGSGLKLECSVVII